MCSIDCSTFAGKVRKVGNFILFLFWSTRIYKLSVHIHIEFNYITKQKKRNE